METAPDFRKKSQIHDAVVRCLPLAAVCTDTGGNVFLWNGAAERISGWHEKEVLGRRNPMTAKENESELRARFDEIRGGRPPSSRELSCQRKDGSLISLNVTSVLLHDTDGKVVGLLETFEDVTARKLREETLLRSEERLQLALRGTNDGLWDWDLSTDKVYYSPRWKSMLGYSQDELGDTLDTWKDLVHPDDRDRILAIVQDLLKGRIDKFEVEFRMRHKEGAYRCVLSRAFLADEGGNRRLVGTHVDITARKKAEEKLAHMHDLMRYVISHAQSAIAVHDRDLNYIYVSDQYLKQYKVKEKDIIGRHHYDVFPDLPQKWRDVHQRVLAGAVESKEEDPYVREDGTVDWTRWECRPWFEEDGSIGGLIVYTEVITDRVQREEELRRSESQLRESQRIAKVGSWSWDPAGGTLEWSDETFRRFEKDPITFTPTFQYFLDRIHPEDRESIQRAVSDSLKHDAPYHIQPRIINESGRQWVLEGFGLVERDAEGKPVRFAGTAQDITERRLAEEELETREKQLAESQRIAHIGSWEHNLETGEVFWSDELFRLLGLDPENDPADFSNFFARIHPEDQPVLKQAINETLRTGKRFCVDYRYILPGGETRILLAQAELKADASGKMVVLSGTAQDMTERKHAEDKIRQNEEFVRSILDTVDEGIVVVDRDYRIVNVNKAYCSQVGGCEEEVAGRYCYELTHRSARPCFHEGEECAVREVFESGKPSTALHRHKDADGQLLYVETKAFPLLDASGNIVSAIETITNITEKVLVEEERLKAQKLEAVGTLAGGIAHDFNNLLQGVFGYISLAKSQLQPGEDAHAMMNQAEEALGQATSLAQQLLTFSKGGKPAKKSLMLSPIIERAMRFALSGSSCGFRIAVDEGLWPVEADEGQICQVIQNIAINANDSMPRGGTVEVTAENAGQDPSFSADGRRYVKLTIRDTGDGIQSENITKIFDPYFSTKPKGSGLGLATSFSIVKNHGGTIEVDSKPSEGTTFTLYLPAAEIPSAIPETAVSSASASRRVRVLVMDDEKVVRGVTGRMIDRLGHEVKCVEKGEEAIELLRREVEAGTPFDLAILDLTVRGGLGGKETLKIFREIDPDIKAIVFSGYSEGGVLEDFRSHGFDACLKKPFTLNDLESSINSLIE